MRCDGSAVCIALAVVVALGSFPGQARSQPSPPGTGHDFFKLYAVTFDFETMRILLRE